jgi:4-hydroxy-tetrahydrodipicolinate synthase
MEPRVTSIRPDTTGVFIIAPTPFDDSGQICWTSTHRLVDFFQSVGAHGITILGMMGEAAKLDAQESLDFARHVIGRAGSMPVIVGVSAPGFAAMRTLARGVLELGAAAVMIAPPPTCRTDDQIVTYYRQASEAMGADVPFVIQDYPLASGVIMSTSVIARIITDNPACVMLKAEDWPGLEKISALRRLEQAGQLRRTPILCGNGGLFLDFELMRGADGAMTGYAFAELLVQMCALKTTGDRAKLHDLFDAHLPLIRYEQQPGVGLGVRKYILKRRGLLTSDAQRTPRSVLSADARSEIDLLLERVLSRDKSVRLRAV